MNKFKLSAMLLAPSIAGYEDEETKRDFYSLYGAIALGNNALAKELFTKYELNAPYESDNYEYFDTPLDYALDANLEGVYMYRRVDVNSILEDMTMQDCINFWDEHASDHYHRLTCIKPMEDEDWWNYLATKLGAWNLMHYVWNSGEHFNDKDMYFAYIEDDCRFFSFSTKQELIEQVGKDFFIDNLMN